MIRLLIIGGLLFFGYRKLKALTAPAPETEKDRPDKERDAQLLVQDPFCKAYFPKHEGVALTWRGEEHLFCSPECRDRFAAGEAAPAPENRNNENQ